ncbi:MAG: c-type cytochrome biogenesis protein CcmI [Lonepinella koalarum]|nr:c-type cytochrome biogenesis protein CcmI [Lonepinella koalarum]
MHFWLISTLLSLLIAAVCFYPLLKTRQNVAQTKREQLNKAFYFDRLREIERDEQQGLLENAEQLKTELQQALLEDIPAEKKTLQENRAYGRIWFASGFLTLLIIAGVTYFQVGSWQAQDMLAKTYEKLPHFYERVKEEETKPLSETEMQQFATALRVKVQKEPQDDYSWFMLGQVGMAMDNGQLAADSYAKAHQLQPENIGYKLAYARILMFSEDVSDKNQGQELLKQVIRQDHANTEALSLLAFRYFEQEDYKMAAVTWVMMLKLLPEDDRRRPLIEKSIRSARDALAEQEEEKRKAMTPQKQE